MIKKAVLIGFVLFNIILVGACGAAQPETVTVVETVVVEKEVEVVKEVEVEVVKEVEVIKEVPASLQKIRMAYQSQLDFSDLPSVMAFDLMADKGYVILPTWYASGNLAVAAIASGEADIASGGISDYWQGIAKGGPMTTIMEQSRNGWSFGVFGDIKECADLDGKVVAYHNQASTSKAMSEAFIEATCGGIEPEVVIIPGSENRAAAMLAGEIDGTAMELADAVQLELLAPDEFTLLANFGKDLPTLKVTGLYVSDEFAAENPQAVKDFIEAVLTVHRQIAENPDLLAEEAEKRLEIDPELLDSLVEAHLAVNFWDVNGGLSEEDIQYTLDFFTNVGNIEEGAVTVDDLADLSYLNEVLEEIGQQ